MPGGMPTDVLYVRLERFETNSFLTVKLPYKMPLQVADHWIEDEYPGWDLVNHSLMDPEFSQVEW